MSILSELNNTALLLKIRKKVFLKKTPKKNQNNFITLSTFTGNTEILWSGGRG